MALDSIFMIDVSDTPEAVSKILLDTGLFARGNDYNGRMVVTGPESSISIYAPPISQHALDQAGITATVSLFIANTDHRQSHEWTRNSVRAVTALLRAYSGDALFLYCTDSPALMRKDGRIILDRRAGLWDEGVEPDVLSLVDLPFEWGAIPQL
jgi:acetaldehyde dehydrogenase (acetylating)